jgi:serine/threonine protein kinase/Tol biopolymer transport system component
VNAEHWHDIERIFHEALDRPSREREAFLERECRGDADLRLEVQSLLNLAASAENVLDRPAAAIAAHLVSQPAAPILTGLRLGVYELQGPLGAGGMGVVYGAVDTNLNRPVAIKFLSDELANPTARRRFQREAQTASSLNHPHIVTVHDAGEFEGRQYLVTEFVDGGTLREWTRGAKRGWRQSIDLLTGVADGLAAAHQAGILHRDIKPENILITKSGYAKLADFGLAKLHEPATSADTTRMETEIRTNPGIIVGTVAYMSPEQASGQPLDTRSDIFSFGVVLYEVLAGQRPFTGASDPDVLHAIVHRPAASLPEDVPLPLRMVVEKALEKDPADRFQSMRDMVVDLRRVVRQSTEAPSAPLMVHRVRPGRRWLAPIGASVVILAAAGVLLVSRFRQPAEPIRQQYVPLTNFADSAQLPALSADGRMLAFIRGATVSTAAFGPGEIYVKLLPGGEPVELTHDNVWKSWPKFSPDGARIAYTVFAEDGKAMDTWVVPVLGGRPQLLLTNASALTWIPARNRGAASPPFVLFSEHTGQGFQMKIASSTESRTEQRDVFVPPGAGMAHASYLSPDGRQVLVVEMGTGDTGAGGYGWLPCRLMPFDGSSSGKPVGPSPAQCTDAAWSPDGQWMYFSTNTGNGYHIWRQRYPDGMPEQVTFSGTEENGIAFAPDGSFVTSIGTSQSTVWVHDSTGDRQVTSEGYAFLPSFSPDAKKLYYLVRGGGARNFFTGGLWVADLESGHRQRLLRDFQMQHYTISSDGQRVVFTAPDDAGRTPVWLAALNNGSAPRRLSTMDSWVVHFGAPGEVVFHGGEKGEVFIYRVNEDGSDLQKVIPTTRFLYGVSPDGQWVLAQDTSQDTDLVAYSAGRASSTLICAGCNDPQGPDLVPPPLSWTPDRKFLYLKFGTSVYAIPLKTGQVLPAIPASGFQSKEAVAALPGARLLAEGSVWPGPHPSVYAFTKVATQRNIYRVPVP